MTELCPSCREPLDYPSGDGCAAMTRHENRKPMECDNITLDTDELGIWLVYETEGGNFQQMGHISWQEVTRGVQQALLQERFLIVLQKMGQEFDNE